ncbi:glycosyltransferase family 4 protein [Ornithinimicrobium cerasi]|uniref:Glycosyltransferase involved in cell wall bisynthesis n=1 Tax=Ornithinimicrobium cerasi TaxID=2248773 RepID=A0A285VS33_9MICO|nr:glycosyltransferase family 4 protein [Ornithinimicrobium cerasi]SOC56859.1 Glycosyltransferase involved in cell wall bisynthesis [Ornithinimicrobium cerasi]
MSTQRVAYVCADPGIPVFGTKGASVHIQELVRAWRRRGADVEVYAVRRGSEVPADLADLAVHEVRVGGKDLDPAERERAQRAAAAQLSELVLAARPDVVHERYSLFSTVLATVSAAHACTTVLEVNAPLVDEQREHRVLVDEAGAEAALEAQVAAADVVACVSEQVAGWVRSRTTRPGDADVRVTPNGVNTDRIMPVTPDPSGDPVVVFVGTLKPWHGVEDLLAAAALAQVRWRLRIVGDGPQRSVVERLVARHQLDVELLGAIAPEQVPQALEGAAVAVAPYPASADHYFSPLKVYEYGAAGLPVVASAIGQIPDVVVDGATGVLVPPSDPAALAAALDALVTDPARARRLGAAARRRMETLHSWDSVLGRSLPAPLGASA